MEPKRVRGRKKPETILQDKIIAMLRRKGWHVMPTHGNEYQSGFPDLYCVNRTYGQRWIEVKRAEKYSFTQAQLINFPILSAHGIGIWILVDDTEQEYHKLTKKPNWHTYLKEIQPRARNL